MTKVFCYRDDCANRSTRKTKTVNKAGKPMYLCKCNTIVLSHSDYDLMREDEEEAGNDVSCINFKPLPPKD